MSSRRSIPLPPSLITTLRQYRAEWLQIRLLNPEHKDDIVFRGLKGAALCGNYMNRLFTDILKENDLTHLRLHDLRHLHATLLLTDGCQPRQVQAQMGHARIDITLGTYGHLMPEQKRDTADRMERLLKKAI